MRTFSPTALFVIASLAACEGGDFVPSSSTSSGITSGTSDEGDSAVVALQYQDGSIGCTGTLIAKRAVLTAAHCVDRLPTEICIGTLVRDAQCQKALDAHIFPSYSMDPWRDDLAILHLQEDAAVSPLPFADEKVEDATLASANLRIVGFGATKPIDYGLRERRSGTTRVSSVAEKELTSAANPSVTCGGDSGGPAFFHVGDRELIVGVTRSGDESCAAFSRFTRVDAYRAFVEQYLEHLPPEEEQGCGIAAAPRAGGVGPRTLFSLLGLAALTRRRARSRRARSRRERSRPER